MIDPLRASDPSCSCVGPGTGGRASGGFFEQAETAKAAVIRRSVVDERDIGKKLQFGQSLYYVMTDLERGASAVLV